MAGNNYYLLTFLPSLDRLGSEPPFTCAEFLQRLEADGLSAVRQLAEAVLLSDDLLQRDSFLAGETGRDEDMQPIRPSVLGLQQVRDEAPMPEYLQPEDTTTAKIPSDRIWEAYYYYAAGVARKLDSPFLREWVRFEVSLRNALVEARSRALGLEAGDYFVAEPLGCGVENFAAALSEFAAAENPLAAQRALDSARWAWLDENDDYFSFDDDELAAYAAKLMLTERWYRLTKEQK